MSKAEVYDHIEPEEPTPWWFWCLMAGLALAFIWSLSGILEGFPI